ncbi:hypothetical protein Lal_00019247 [Lupinus albus]|nr:hypothetical protein Lal_00019247 [Lupinus albus]
MSYATTVADSEGLFSGLAEETAEVSEDLFSDSAEAAATVSEGLFSGSADATGASSSQKAVFFPVLETACRTVSGSTFPFTVTFCSFKSMSYDSTPANADIVIKIQHCKRNFAWYYLAGTAISIKILIRRICFRHILLPRE